MISTGQTYNNAAIGYDDEILQDIHLSTKNIAIIKRSIESLETELATVATKTLECRASGTVAEILPALNDFFSGHLTHCSLLLDDVVNLLELFEKTTQASSFRLLLTTVSTDMCRKFHTDINDLRLLCTYIGPGTLWLPDEVAEKTGSDDQEIVINESHIQQVLTGDVVVLKGALYPESTPVLHRSPSIAEQEKKRFLLRIDTNSTQNLWS